MTKHGGKRNGAGPKPTPFFSRVERLAFKDDAERAAYMSLTSRERVVLALWAAKVMATTPPAQNWVYGSPSHEYRTDDGRDGDVEGGKNAKQRM